jgi:exopolyphosphatase / guanosine-5'-triphosphate,3'-diphosphate pyrophosphatase
VADHGSDGTTPLFGAIDVGTDTTRLLVARVVDGRPKVVASGASRTGLGDAMATTRRFTAAAMERTEQAVGAMVAEAHELGVTEPVIALTGRFRDALNGDELLERLEKTVGTRPLVLTAIEETRLTFTGLVAAAQVSSPVLAVDLGAASLELMGGTSEQLDWAASVPLGTLLLNERYDPSDPPSLDVVGPMLVYARSLLDRVAEGHPVEVALAIGGGAEAVGLLAETDHLDRNALVHALERLAAMPAEDLADDMGISVARVALCLCGTTVLEAVRRAFDLEHLTVSRAGLREGLVLERA